MLTTVRGAYKQGKVELTETPTGVEEDAPVLVTFLSEVPTPTRSPQNLYGAWRGKFPQDFDLDAALNEIRGAWQKEWNEDSTNA